MKNKEIEELLNDIKFEYNNKEKWVTDMALSEDAWGLLLSCIEQQEKDNKDLDKENQILFESNLKLQNNRDKAIEFIEKYRTHEKIGNNDYLKDRDDFGDLDRWQVFELIDILKGDSDE